MARAPAQQFLLKQHEATWRNIKIQQQFLLTHFPFQSNQRRIIRPDRLLPVRWFFIIIVSRMGFLYNLNHCFMDFLCIVDLDAGVLSSSFRAIFSSGATHRMAARSTRIRFSNQKGVDKSFLDYFQATIFHSGSKWQKKGGTRKAKKKHGRERGRRKTVYTKKSITSIP